MFLFNINYISQIWADNKINFKCRWWWNSSISSRKWGKCTRITSSQTKKSCRKLWPEWTTWCSTHNSLRNKSHLHKCPKESSLAMLNSTNRGKNRVRSIVQDKNKSTELKFPKAPTQTHSKKISQISVYHVWKKVYLELWKKSHWPKNKWSNR